jgi:hypothetical protein
MQITEGIRVSRIFPKNSRQIAATLGVGFLLLGGLVTAAVTYYFTPKYTRVGYTPYQPVPYSHRIMSVSWASIAPIVIPMYSSRRTRMSLRPMSA